MIRPAILHRVAAWLFAALFAVLLAAPLSAQVEEEQYSEWNTLAVRAEQVIDDNAASQAALETLRTEIVGWRENFLRAESTNASRIQTLRSQIDALGAPPEEGVTEDPEIAARRADLDGQLNQLMAPVTRAQEAYTRADGLVREIDGLIRTRQTDELLALGPTPLNPQIWPEAARAVLGSVEQLWTEMRRKAGSATAQAEMRKNLPVIMILLAMALLLVARGPHWVRRLGERLRRRTRRGTGVWRFLVSLGGIILPLSGLICLTAAVRATGLAGLNASRLLDMVPIWGGTLLIIRWLADRSFNRDDSIATLPLPAGQRTEAWLYATVLAFLFVLRSIGDTMAEQYAYGDGTRVVLDFPVLVLCAMMLFRLGHILVRLTPPEAAPADGDDAPLLEGSTFRLQIARLLGRASMIVAFAGPAMSVVGYDRVGQAMVYPSILTLALLALVLVLQRFFNDLYTLITGKDADGAESLAPVFAAFLLAVASLPLLALIWGARVADLTELWTRLGEGFVLGGTRISPTSFLTMIAVFLIGLGMTRLLQGGLRSSVLPRTRIDIGGQNAIISGLGYAGIILAALLGITTAGIDLTALGYVAGALSVGIGFGLQNIVSNFVSGIILLIERPISEGDWIEVGPNMGIVKDISVRSTRIETFDRTDVIVPNSDFISGTVTNYTKGNILGRVYMSIGVAYGSDTHKVEDILRAIVRQHDMVLMNPEPSVVFASFGADSLNFEIRAIIRDVGKKLNVASDFNHEIARRFAEEGIEIPYAQRDIWLRNPEALFDRGRDATKGPAPVPPPAEPVDAPHMEPESSNRQDGVMPIGRAGDEGEDH
ncbi:DUF3772 domain-containing protein [Salipiger sp.]|uniref:DUF3772 domain-containing protein n=1 Tax=Salipiger sp. TaxID=2078585 RepID=UPI003A979392